MTHARFTRNLIYRRPTVCLQVDFPLPPGITALTGPAAAGKSTVLNAIAGFEYPDTGRILVEDAIVFDRDTNIHLPPRRRQVGYIGPTDALFPNMTIKQNLMFGAQRWARLERHKRVALMAERFDLAAAMESKPADLSPIQKLNCAVARALLAEPKLLLIDDRGAGEPLLARLRDAFAGPILLVTRDLNLCYAAAAELILLDAGRIVQRGPARQLIENPESVDAARLLGIDNIFPAEIAALDPGRKTSLLKCAAFELSAPYLPGHFNGDQVSAAIRAQDVRVHSGEIESGVNFVPAQLARVVQRARSVRLEFAGGIAAEMPRAQWERQRDNRSWQVEFPPPALRVF
jgi:molybdate transport system ATP-binding protein